MECLSGNQILLGSLAKQNMYLPVIIIHIRNWEDFAWSFESMILKM